MFSQNKFFTTALVGLVLVGLSLSSCASVATLQPTPLLNITATTLPSTQTQTTPTIVVLTETPEQISGFTDATLQAQTKGAIESTKTLISSLPNASQDEIVKTLLVKWLDYYKTDKVDAYFRLRDYKIEEVRATSGYCPPPDKDTTKFAARVQFSIQTVTAHPGDWVVLPGEIILGDENWIYHLFPYVSISASNGIYTFTMEGSMPCS